MDRTKLELWGIPLPVALAVGGAATLGGIALANKMSVDIVALNTGLGAAMGIAAAVIAEGSHKKQLAALSR